MRTSSKILAVLAVALLTLSTTHPKAVSQESGKPGEPLIILAELQNHRVTYKVDGKDALPDLLRVLNTVDDQRGRDTKVIVLLDARASITEIGDIEGTLGKAGFEKVRFFIFNREANVMSTVEFGRTVPFSTRPPWE
jgi:biopolymer transport protein ExbD